MGAWVVLTDRLWYGIHPSVVLPSGIDVFYDLTDEDLPSWNLGKGELKRYPIKDRSTPTLEMLEKIVLDVIGELERGKRVYIFCKGGHGRSGMVAAAVYGKLFGLKGEDAIEHINAEWHKQRDLSKIRPKIRRLGSPQNKKQKAIVIKFLKNCAH